MQLSQRRRYRKASATRSELAFQQIRAVDLFLRSGVAFSFWCSPQFESLTLPIAIILIVPMSLVVFDLG